MDVPKFDIADLGERWGSPSEAEAAAFDEELRAEMPVGHAIEDLNLHPVAVKKNLKDWVVWLPAQGRWAAVHLTYRQETDARWPSVAFADTWSGLLAEIL